MDPVRSLLDDLRSPDPAIRCSVLPKIRQLDWTVERRETLRNFLTQESDVTTRFHVQQILHRIEEKVHSTPKDLLPKFEALLESPDRDYLALALCLEDLSAENAPLALITLREHNWPDFPAFFLPTILKFIQQYGSFEDCDTLEKLCRHHDPWVIAASIEALEKLGPNSLKDLVVPLLNNPSNGIRSRAIRLLTRWDPEEALRQFEEQLFSDDLDDRHAALLNAIFFPFPEIEPMLLQFLSLEQVPSLIAKAGILFQANPSPEEPLRLLELKGSCRGEKRQLIAEIYRGVLETLYQAKMVTQPPDQMAAELEELFQRRKTTQYLEQLQLALHSSDPQTREFAVRKLCLYANTSSVQDTKAALLTHARRETDPRIKHILENLVQLEKTKIGPTGALQDSPIPGLTAEIDALVATKTEDEQQINFTDTELDDETPISDDLILADIPQEITPSWLKTNREHFPSLLKTGSIDERMRLLTAIAGHGLPIDAPLLFDFLRDNDPTVVATALDGLSSFNPQGLIPFLPELLRHPAPIVRATAIRAFALFDKRKAVALTERLIFSKRPEVREMGILNASQLDFPAMKDVLTKAILTEETPHLIRQILSILQTNTGDQLYFALQEAIPGLDEKRRAIFAEFVPESFLTKPKTTKSPQKAPPTENQVSSATHIEKKDSTPGKNKKLKTEKSEPLLPDLPPTDQPPIPDCSLVATMPIASQRKWVESISSEEIFGVIRKRLKKDVLSSLHRAPLLELIKRIRQFGGKEDVELLIPFLDHKDPTICADVIHCIGKLDLDRLIPFIGSLLMRSHSKVALAALKVLLQYDREGALGQIKTMINSPRVGVRRVIMAILPDLEFSSVENLVLDFFDREIMRDLKIEIGNLIAANPSEDSMYRLYRGTHFPGGKVSSEFETFWESAMATASGVLGANRFALETRWRERVEKESGRKSDSAATTDEKKPTAVENIKNFLSEVDPQILKSVAIVVVLFLIIIPFMGRNSEEIPIDAPQEEMSYAPNPELAAKGHDISDQKPQDLIGMVIYVSPEKTEITVSEHGTGDRFYVQTTKAQCRIFFRGASFQGRIQPWKETSQGMIAKLIKTF